mmetsp:Transcript_29309/g.68133  ORF Transcript_29309/g.68133 Transcript_29309/m.68133 type:complete len:175 (-) Transcript_29309:79-603(-)
MQPLWLTAAACLAAAEHTLPLHDDDTCLAEGCALALLQARGRKLLAQVPSNASLARASTGNTSAANGSSANASAFETGVAANAGAAPARAAAAMAVLQWPSLRPSWLQLRALEREGMGVNVIVLAIFAVVFVLLTGVGLAVCAMANRVPSERPRGYPQEATRQARRRQQQNACC